MHLASEHVAVNRKLRDENLYDRHGINESSHVRPASYFLANSLYSAFCTGLAEEPSRFRFNLDCEAAQRGGSGAQMAVVSNQVMVCARWEKN